jgi:ribosomal protein S1
MTSSIPPKISDYTARNISLKQLRLWSEAGDAHKQELIKLLKEIRTKLARDTSPSKAVTFATKSLENFYSKKEVRGEVTLLNNRHIKFNLMFPGVDDQDLQFCLVYGEINARSKACKFDETTPIKISAHALQRLLARLDLGSDEKALDELYSCIKLVIPWHTASVETGAQCWPLISEHGFFVGAPSPDSLVTTLITWMKADGLSKKWLQPLQNLWHLQSKNSAPLEDPVFAAEFLYSFPWMLKEHVPGLDLPSLAWESKDFDSTPDPISQEKTLDLQYHDDQDSSVDAPKPYKKKSSSYLAGLNYSDTPPPIKVNNHFTGLVVQKRDDGNMIVGLKNGWVGNLPAISIERGYQLIENYVAPEIGDEIEVEVQKIKPWMGEDAYLISLNPVDVTEAHWATIEKKLPINSELIGKVVVDLKNKFGVKLENGTRGIVDKNEVLAYLQVTHSPITSPIDLELKFQVTGFDASKKNIILSIPNLTDLQKNALTTKIHIGRSYRGTCTYLVQNFSIIDLGNGCSGMLHRNNSWGSDLPKVGETIDVNVIYIDMDIHEIGLSIVHDDLMPSYFNCLPATDAFWNTFITNHAINDIVKVQAKEWLEGSQGFIVASESGMRGFIPKKELAWPTISEDDAQKEVALGDIFDAKIVKINDAKRKVAFSKRMAEPHPLEDPRVLDLVGKIFIGKVTSVVNYGCFILLPALKIEGLLHQSKIPDGINLEVGELVEVLIADFDRERRRISLSLI